MKRTIPFLTAVALVGLVAGCSERDDLLEPGGVGSTLESEDTGPFAGDDEAEFERGCDPGHGVSPSTRTYEITLENLTPDTGDGGAQVFSPPVIAVHGSRMHMWKAGRRASGEFAGVAEDALNGPLVDHLAASPRVLDVVAADGPILPGGSAIWTIATERGFRRLSMGFMLVNTNDGFGGVDAARLPRSGEESWYLYAHDAGSEENTELFDHIPGPCCGSPGAGPDTDDRIHPHPGLHGGGDLDPAKWGWEGPVAKLTVRRLAPAWEVAVENLSPATVDGGSQVFSPPVFASHGSGLRLFKPGRHASTELEAIAEDGMNGAMLDLIAGSGHAMTWGDTGAPVFPGDGLAFEVEGGHHRRRLSVVFMLVNTNDAFSGVNRVRLPSGGRATHWVGAWDAGTEENTELMAHIPGPCCGSPGEGIATMEPIGHHPGLHGGGDLDPADWGWDDPVAKVTLTRIR